MKAFNEILSGDEALSATKLAKKRKMKRSERNAGHVMEELNAKRVVVK